MNFYKNLKISSKLLIGFVIVALLSGVVGIIAIVNDNRIISLGNQLYEENLVPLQPAAKIEIDFLKVRVSLRDMALAKTPEAKAKFSNNIDTVFKDLQDNVQSYSKCVSSPEKADNLKAMQELITKYDALKEQMRGLINSNRVDEAIVIMNGDASVVTGQLDASITKAFQLNIDQAADRQAAKKTAGNIALFTIVFVIIWGIVLAIILGLVISKIIGNPISTLVEAAKSIADGDLNVKLSVDTKDEVGALGEAFEKTIASLKNLVKDSNILVQAAVEGKLSTRADATKHTGDYRMIVEGVNKTLDAVIEPIKEAENGDTVSPGRILISPGGQHMELNKRGNNYFVECFTGDKVNGHCPSVDVLFKSVSEKAGSSSIGIILTGMGYDGAKGLLKMKQKVPLPLDRMKNPAWFMVCPKLPTILVQLLNKHL